ncbi:MAG: two-component regulator propeller domain-containing protein, partial [Bacteroidota bacterium]|nr:two-component regulator propeller domain-containing protein [Bacteroidota bacterium]
MWFGSADGLYRYDGYRFKKFIHDPSDSQSISGGNISCILEDNKGSFWFGCGFAGLNKYDPFSNTFKLYLPNPDTSSNSVNGIIQIYQDKNGTLWTSTPTGGLHEYIDSTDSFKTYKYDTINWKGFKNFISCIHEYEDGFFLLGTWGGALLFDSKKKEYTLPDGLQNLNFHNIRTINEDLSGRIWIGTLTGLYRYDKEEDKLVRFQQDGNNQNRLSSQFIEGILQNPDQQEPLLYISTDIGLNVYNLESEENQVYYHDPSDPQSIAYDNIHSTYLDNNILWLGFENSGISCANLLNIHYEYFSLPQSSILQEPYSATSFLKDRNGFTWIGTLLGGLFKYNKEMELVDHITINPDVENCLYCNFIYSLYQCPEGDIWIGTVNEGLWFYDESKDELIKCNLYIKGVPSPYERINSIYKDSFGAYWAGSFIGRGLFYHDPNTPEKTELHHIEQDPLGYTDVRDFHEDDNRNLWVITCGEGIYILTPENRDSLVFEKFKVPSGSGNIFRSLFTTYIDINNELWFGGLNGLIKYSFTDSSFSHYNSENGLEADFIYDIEGDGKYLWLSSDKGLLRFDPKERGNNRTKVMRYSDGVPFEDIYTFDIYRSDDGFIYVGGKRGSGKGFYRFHPDSIKQNKHVPPIVITDFQVKNKAVTLDSAITGKKAVILDYHENYFSLEFAALDYFNPDMNQYAYKLEGVDEDWIQSGTRRFVNYTGISPGSYIFRVRGSNNDGIWNEAGTSLAITILPPPWKTWWAYLLYGIALSALLLALRLYDLKRQRLKQNLELEKVEKDKLGELDRMKSRFFANISHEFRTPLTLILGPLRNLEQETVSQKSKKDLNIIQRNALRLQQLINQLLSLSKLESGQMKLQARELNIVQLVKGYTHSFESLAKQKDIKLEFKSETDKLMLWVDQDKIEKILYNLLSNAFKYTGSGGSIGVSVGQLDNWQLDSSN